jgi:hypothetical protein
MQTLSNILLLAEIVLFTLFMANVGNLIIHLLIDNNAND